MSDQTGGHEPVPVGIERNPDAAVELGAQAPAGVPLYVLRVGVRGGFGGTRAGLPVHRRENQATHPILKEIYHCEVAGKVVEAANIYALRAKVQRELDVIAPAHSLPLCYFRAPRFDYSLPVHEEGSHLVCPVLVGPKIKAASLAELREPVVAHLRAAGYLMTDEEPDLLVVRPSDLRLVPPAAIIRCLDDGGFWLPTVEGVSPDGPVVGLLSHSAELETGQRRIRRSELRQPPPSAADITTLLRHVAGHLLTNRSLADPWALYACEVRPEIWARTEELTDPTDRELVAHLEDVEGSGRLEVPVRHTAAGEAVGAIREAGISVFLAGDHDALATAIGRYLVASGFLRDAADLRAEIVREAPPEHLDPDAIWAHTEPAAAITTSAVSPINEDREVEST